MSQSILSIRKCSRCKVEPNYMRYGEGYGIKCLMCGFEITGSDIYGLIPSWNSYNARLEQEKEDRAIKACTKSATDIICEVRDAMCNDYCRYMHEGKSSLTPEDEKYCEDNGCLPQCDDCPLNRL